MGPGFVETGFQYNNMAVSLHLFTILQQPSLLIVIWGCQWWDATDIPI